LSKSIPIRIKRKDKEDVIIYWAHLKAIADYYDFPSAVFLMQPKDFTKRTKAYKNRMEHLFKEAEKLEQIREILDGEPNADDPTPSNMGLSKKGYTRVNK